MQSSIQRIKSYTLLLAILVILPFKCAVAQDFVGDSSEFQTGIQSGMEYSLDDGIGSGKFKRWSERLNRRSNRAEKRVAKSDYDLGTSRTFSISGSWTYDLAIDSFGDSVFPRATLDDGYAVGIAMGKRLGPRFRSELEIAYRRNEVIRTYDGYFPFNDIIFASPLVEGEIHTYSGMANLYFDFDRGPDRLLTPYVGVGLGAAYLDTEVFNLSPFRSTTSETAQTTGSTVSNETLLAFQAIGGVSAKLTRRADLFAEYRYFVTSIGDFTFPAYSQPGLIVEDRVLPYRIQVGQLNLGLRFKY